jgi:hypothetical protein
MYLRTCTRSFPFAISYETYGTYYDDHNARKHEFGTFEFDSEANELPPITPVVRIGGVADDSSVIEVAMLGRSGLLR